MVIQSVSFPQWMHFKLSFLLKKKADIETIRVLQTNAIHRLEIPEDEKADLIEALEQALKLRENQKRDIYLSEKCFAHPKHLQPIRHWPGFISSN